jgi:NAD-dependent DNA ligase
VETLINERKQVVYDVDGIYFKLIISEPEESIQFQKKENHWKVKVEDVRKILFKFRIMIIN